jgi:O-antigen ligase
MRSERLTFGHGALAAVPARTTAAAAAALAHEAGPVRLLRLETWDWGWGGLLMFSVLLFFRPQDQIFGALGELHLSDISAIIGLAGMLMVNLGRREPLFRMTPEVIGVFFIGLVILLTAPFSIWPGGAIGVLTDMYMQVMLIFLLMVNTVTSPKRVDRICWVIIVAFGYISTRVVFDYLRGVNLVEGNRAAGPAGGFFENPNDLALNLAAFLPLALMYIRRPGPGIRRLLAAGVAVMMLVALVFTKSRGGFIAALAMLATYLLVARLLKPGMLIALVLAGLLAVPMIPGTFWDRMASITDAERDPTGSRQERIELMKQAWRVFQAYPFTGIGAGQFQNYQEPGQVQHWRVTHNTPLQFAAELGVLGVIGIFFLFFRGLGAARWAQKRLRGTLKALAVRRRAPPDPEDGLEPGERQMLNEHAAALIACMVAWFVAAQFASVGYNWTLYYLLGLCVTTRDVVRARAKAYARAKKIGTQEVVAA